MPMSISFEITAAKPTGSQRYRGYIVINKKRIAYTGPLYATAAEAEAAALANLTDRLGLLLRVDQDTVQKK